MRNIGAALHNLADIRRDLPRGFGVVVAVDKNRKKRRSVAVIAGIRPVKADGQNVRNALQFRLDILRLRDGDVVGCHDLNASRHAELLPYHLHRLRGLRIGGKVIGNVVIDADACGKDEGKRRGGKIEAEHRPKRPSAARKPLPDAPEKVVVHGIPRKIKNLYAL